MKNTSKGVKILVYVLGYLLTWPILWTFINNMNESPNASYNARYHKEDQMLHAYLTTMFSIPWPLTLPVATVAYIGYSIFADDK